MFILTPKTLAKARERASERTARVSVTRFGMYSVTGDTGRIHLVECFRDAQGRKIVACNCRAGKGRQPGAVCYHSGHAIEKHLDLAKERMVA